MVYSQIASHRRTVFHEHRNALYGQALRSLVTPDSVVMGLGAGLGIHGLIAATAGAKRVNLVEPEPIARVAQEIAQSLFKADRQAFQDFEDALQWVQGMTLDYVKK